LPSGTRLDLHLPGLGGYGDRTIRSLLSHSSGMHSEPVGPWWERSPGGSFEQRILQPLGMRRTSYLARPPAATGYSVHHFAGTLTEEPAHDTGAMAPAGQLWSSIGTGRATPPS
jgi:CubicO group peptidase (beta-lactamase class C family)